MKNFILRSCIVLLALTCVLCLPALSGGEEAFETEINDGREVLYSGDFAYILEAGQATIVGHSGSMYAWDREWPVPGEEQPATDESAGGVGDQLVIPSRLDGHPVTAIGDGAFLEGFYNDITIEEGIARIGDGAFAACYYIRAFILPESVTYIHENFFEGSDYGIATTVFRVREGSYAAEFVEENEFPFTYDPEYMVFVSGDWFYTLTDGLATIFGYCGNAVDLTIPDALDGYPVTALEYGEPYNSIKAVSNLTSVTLPEGIARIGDDEFGASESLASVTIPEGCISIRGDAFRNCPNLTLTVTEGSYGAHYAEENGIPYVYDARKKGSSGDYQYTVTDGKATLTAYHGNDAELVIPDAVDGYPVIAIGDFVFQVRGDLKRVMIPQGIAAIGAHAFKDCKALTDVSMPLGMTVIGEGAFDGCESLVSADIPTGVMRIEKSAFRGCKSLSSVVIPEWLTEIGGSAFEGCESLTGVALPKGVRTIGNNAFRGCTSLSSTIIPEGITAIGERTFDGCENLNNATLPEGVTSIDDYAFAGCSSLSITLPKSGTTIGKNAFSRCESLSGIVLPEGVTSIGSNAFSGCESLREVAIPQGVTVISFGTFQQCKGLTGIVIPSSVTLIEDAAFSLCTSLVSVHVPQGVTEIGRATFSGCESLTSIILPQSVTEIGSEAFCGCKSLASLVIPATVEIIKENAFDDCPNLTLTVAEGSYAAWFA